MKKKDNLSKNWIMAFLLFIILIGSLVCSITIYIDPYFHYHKPFINKYWYTLDNQRSQNNGIIRNFDYDALITGTSITENFKSSDADRLFNTNSIKVPFSGGTFGEMNDNIRIALETHPNIRYVFRSLDRYKIMMDKDAMRDDMGNYPTYLYDKNPFNDVNYLLNRDVLYTRIWNMTKGGVEKTGITSFDEYSSWDNPSMVYGQQAVLRKIFNAPDSRFIISDESTGELTDEQKEKIRGNIEQNVTDLADKYSDTLFYYFLPPYSAAYWGENHQDGSLDKTFEIEKYAMELILQHDNIHLFMWNRFDILDDLNNYKDSIHYGEWVNSWMMKQMFNNSGRITIDNYQTILSEESEHYNGFDYNSLFEQEDYEADYYAAALMNKEINSTEPYHVGESLIEYSGVHGDSPQFTVDVTDFCAVTFKSRVISGEGQNRVLFYNDSGELIKTYDIAHSNDEQWHLNAIRISDVKGKITVVFECSGIDNIELWEHFNDIVLF